MLIYKTESVDYLKDDSLFMHEYARVPAYRKRKIDALMRPEDKRLSLGAELLLEKVLREAGFSELAETRDIVLSDRGKPCFIETDSEGTPVCAGLPCFCLSHSGERVMCALSDRPVGCDIEEADRRNTDCTAIARRFFSEAEAARVEADEGTFWGLWTMKEAYAKCVDVPLPDVLGKDIGVLVQNTALKTVQGEEGGYRWTVVYRE